jgi:hypothetical protein
VKLRAVFRGDGPTWFIVVDSPFEQTTDRLRSRKSKINAPFGIFDDTGGKHGFQETVVLGVSLEDEFVLREPDSSNVDRDCRVDFAIQLVDELDCQSAVRVFVEFDGHASRLADTIDGETSGHTQWEEK